MNWKEQLKNSVHKYDEISNLWGITEPLDNKIITSFPLQITPHYLNLINSSDPNDPLKKIVIPQKLEIYNEGLEDTMGEHEDYKAKGLQHRYAETALLMVNNYCASYCRFCFRKRLFNPLRIEDESVHDIKPAIEYIKSHKEISNVILSGGDPLVSSTTKLNSILEAISEIEHIKYIRIGSKIPAFLPQRIYEDEKLIDILRATNKKKPIYIFAHFDHPNEISKETVLAIDKLIENGLEILGHVVLLKDINCNGETLVELMNKMVQCKILPYYIFHSMPAKGTEHFQITLKNGMDAINAANKQLSGLNKHFKYILPHYIGKTEFIGYDNQNFYFKQHQARKKENIGRMFKVKFEESKTWFDEKEMIPL